MKKPSFYLFLTLLLLGACTQKETVIKNTTSSSDPISSDSNGGSGTTTSTNGSNVNTELQTCGAKTGNEEVDNYCYHVVSPTVIAHGNPLANNEFLYQTSLHATGIPQSYFNSDYKFQIRLMPKMAAYNESTNGRSPTRVCGVPTNASGFTYTKMAVTIELKNKTQNYSVGTRTIYADLVQNTTNGLGWTPSTKAVFNTNGLSGEYDIIVKNIKTNHRCSEWGTKNTSCTVFEDLPYVRTQTSPTDCVAFEIHFATDFTRNLP